MTCYQSYKAFDDIKILLNNKTRTFYLICLKIIRLYEKLNLICEVLEEL